MRRPLVAANWKMNGTLGTARSLADAVVTARREAGGAQVLLCPPFAHLTEVARSVAGSRVALGAQDVAQWAQGAYTGEVSAAMLRDAGCTHTIVGHSERRRYCAESDEVVAAKLVAARREGLVPIACVGETLAERESGDTAAVVTRQLQALLEVLDAPALAEVVIAYEPLWAIGTGRTATPQQANEVHATLRALVRARFGAAAESLRILYGGSVTAANAAGLCAEADVDGGLVGGASLDAAQFLEICRAADEAAVRG